MSVTGYIRRTQSWRGGPWAKPSAIAGGSQSAETSKVGAAGSNLPFDDRMQYSSSPWVSRLARGHVQRYDNALKRVVGTQFFFLFNPNQITVTYGVHGSAKSADDVDIAANVGGVGGPSQMGFSFKLLFDRSYEVAYGGNKEGCLKDVETLETMCGITSLRPFLSKGDVFRFVLGHNFVFYAWIERLSVEYINFSEDMVPMRCSVEIGATVYSIDASEKANMAHTGHGSIKHGVAKKKGKAKARGRGRSAASTASRGRRGGSRTRNVTPWGRQRWR